MNCFQNVIHLIFFCLEFLRLPFEWKTPIGYIFAVALQCTVLWIAIFVSKFIGTFSIAAFLLLISFTDDIKYDLNTIKINIKMEENRSKIIKQIVTFVQFHSKAIEFSTFLLCFIWNDFSFLNVI